MNATHARYVMPTSSHEHIFCLFLCSAVTDEENVSETEGGNVTLYADLTAIQKYDVSMIQWYYGHKNNCIAKIKAGETPDPSPGADGRFRGKLSLKENGDLTITDIRTLYSGLYIMKFTSGRRTKYKRFIVSVTREFILCVNARAPREQ